MSQTRALSFAEAALNTVIGYAVALLAQAAIFPAVGLQATLVQHLQVGAGFALVSIVRGYALRRLFEALTARRRGVSR